MGKKICEISDITQGSILTRIKAIGSGQVLKAITMQELSYYINASDEKGESNEIVVENKKIDNACFSRKGDILVGLSSGKAMVVEDENNNKLILSNFIRIRINDFNLIDPYYLCWTLNENRDILRAIVAMTQGTARVSILPLAFLKDIEINIIPIEEQRKIGRIYELSRRRRRIRRNKEVLNYEINNKLLMEVYRKNKLGGNNNE